MDGTELGHDEAGNLTDVGGDIEIGYSPTGQMQDKDAGGTGLDAAITYDTADSTQRRTLTQGSGEDAVTQTLTNTALGISSIEQEDGDRTRYVRDPPNSSSDPKWNGSLPAHGMKEWAQSRRTLHATPRAAWSAEPWTRAPDARYAWPQSWNSSSSGMARSKSSTCSIGPSSRSVTRASCTQSWVPSSWCWTTKTPSWPP